MPALSPTHETERWRRICDAILANTPDLAYVLDRQHRFVYANPALLAMWGKTWAEAKGRTCLQLGYDPWHAAMHDREIEQLVASKQPVRGEVPFTGTNGRRVYDYIFVPVLDANGEVEAIAGTTRDITERTLAEAEQRRLAEVVTHSGDMIETAALNGAVTYINPAGLQMLGWEAIPPQATLRDFFPPDRADQYLRDVRRRQMANEGWEGEVEFQNRLTGERLPVHAKAFAIRQADGQAMARGFIARDLRESRRAEAALMQADKLAAMGRLAATMAHEINNPLAAAVSATYLLCREPELAPGLRPLVQQIEAELERVSAVTRHTLGYFRAEPEMGAVDLAEMLRGVAGAFSPRAARCHVPVKMRLAPGIEVQGFGNELRQVFTNLVANALDAMGTTGGTLLICLGAARADGGADACVTIADTGPGISPGEMEHIFEPFITGRRGGIGLGLWVSRGIVLKHGGTLRAKNRRRGGVSG
ncbi:MAG: PAS domain S-box protein [Terriglobales bacterium]